MEQDRLGYAKVYVSVDLSSPPPKVVKVRRPNGELCLVEVQYSLRPVRCQFCGNVGHEEAFCRFKRDAEAKVGRPSSKGVVQEAGSSKGVMRSRSIVSRERRPLKAKSDLAIPERRDDREQSVKGKEVLISGPATAVEEREMVQPEIVKDSLEGAEDFIPDPSKLEPQHRSVISKQQRRVRFSHQLVSFEPGLSGGGSVEETGPALLSDSTVLNNKGNSTEVVASSQGVPTGDATLVDQFFSNISELEDSSKGMKGMNGDGCKNQKKGNVSSKTTNVSDGGDISSHPKI